MGDTATPCKCGDPSAHKASRGAHCPQCGNEWLQEHSLTWWCLECGWARNKPARPGGART